MDKQPIGASQSKLASSKSLVSLRPSKTYSVVEGTARFSQEGDFEIDLSEERTKVELNEEDRSHDIEVFDEPEMEKEPELPYEPPPMNFIRVEFGVSSSMMMNHNCKKKTFVDYINSRLDEAVPMSAFDMMDTEGHVVGLRHISTRDNVEFLFEPPKTYVPCQFLLDEDSSEIIGIEPCLNGFSIKYPKIEQSIQQALYRPPPKVSDAQPGSTRSSFVPSGRDKSKDMSSDKKEKK